MHAIFVLLIAVAVVLLLIIRLRINAFVALVTAALTVGIMSPRVRLVDAMPEAARLFGEVAGKIGIVIALAAVIGQCLMESGAADKIARRIVSLLGDQRSSLALLISGFVLAIPVFFDTVFYLLIPLARAMRVRTGRNYLLYIMAISAGGAVAHTLIPPTPGPVAMAGTLGVDLGAVILAGVVVGFPVTLVGWLFARYMDRKLKIELREAPGLSMQELERVAHRPEAELPGFAASLLPIGLPVIFITSATAVSALKIPGVITDFVTFLGNPNFALLISTAIALYILARQKRYSLGQLANSVEAGLANGGLIVLITCAGGALGGMLVLAGVGETLNQLSGHLGASRMLLGFVLAALFKVAQGSGTVAMITTAAILSPLIQGAALPFHPVYVVMSIGAGSLVGIWMNDSGFWVVKQMSGLTEVEVLKTHSSMLAMVGVLAFVVTVVLSQVFPLT